MLLSSCKWVSGVSGEMKFGILVGGLKTTYHALRPWLDLRIWKSKDFLMYNFSASDQSTAAGHEDLSPSLSQYSIFWLARHSASVSESRVRLTLTTLDHSQPKVLSNSQGPWRPPPLLSLLLPLHFYHLPPYSNPLFAPPWPLPGSLII